MAKNEVIKEKINKIFNFIGINPAVSITDGIENSIEVNVKGDNLSFLIGYRGEALDALQHFLMVAVNSNEKDWVRIDLDINDYKKQRMEKIETIVKNVIDKVRFFGKDFEMVPMPSSERFIVHTFVSEYDDVISESIGDGMNRRVVIKPKVAKAAKA